MQSTRLQTANCNLQPATCNPEGRLRSDGVAMAGTGSTYLVRAHLAAGDGKVGNHGEWKCEIAFGGRQLKRWIAGS